ncbi:hypothetical protein Q4566_06030 [Tamlana sp. 2_MG-2023]|uniref:hypothetical protein n=1 Tax=unclassified Tamlana TaxID=2614803 RepID=UPI0026E2C19B|nr:MULTISPECIES: hypothetical protein [unclassified Tamlana]MDO6759753.1 hypothetical protein [Tamlana sp. 2_MG-2023]MDO6791376.1 hypothetical protein [Tamlana sp. 1_MG-2023]
MKLNFNKIFFILLVAQIISVQGIIVFNIFKFFGNWELKSYLHLTTVIFTLATVAFYRLNKGTIKLSLTDIMFLVYSIFCFFVLLYNIQEFESIVIAFREVLLLGLLVFAYQQISLSEKYWNKILRLLHILVILNLVFIGLTYVLGPRAYMELVTGRYRWPHDPDYKFKISSFLMFWRSPGLIGSPGNVGYFGLLTYLLFDQNEKYKKKAVWPILLAIVGFVRSVYLVLAVYWVLKFFLTKKNLKIIKEALPYLVPIFLIVGYFLYSKGILDLTSLAMRIDHWVHDINVDFNVLLGMGIGEAGGAVRGAGFVATLDNYWLLMLISTGLLGVILLLLFFYEKAIENMKLKYALVGFLCAGIFITLTQGMAFLVLFPMLFIRRTGLIQNEEYADE